MENFSGGDENPQTVVPACQQAQADSEGAPYTSGRGCFRGIAILPVACDKQRKRLVRGEEKPVTNFGARSRGELIGMLVEALILLPAHKVAGTHLGPVLVGRSSNRRYLASMTMV